MITACKGMRRPIDMVGLDTLYTENEPRFWIILNLMAKMITFLEAQTHAQLRTQMPESPII